MKHLNRHARVLAPALALGAVIALLVPLAHAGKTAPRTQARPGEVAVGLTLEQAVARVQKQTAGKVLQADSRQMGQVTEYRIKVLTPDGHVRVVPVRSRPAPGKGPKASKHKETR